MNTIIIVFMLMFAQYGYGLVMDTATSTDALMVMLAEEKQLRAQFEIKVTGQVTDLQNKVNSLESSQECGCDGRLTEIPAFMAALSNDRNCSKGQKVVFDDIKLNRGQGYSKSNGIFTAPITGTYMFTTTLSSDPNGTYHIALVKGNATNEIAYMYAVSTTQWSESSTTVVTHLDAGNDVWMVCVSNSKIEGNANHAVEGAADFHSHLSGFLVSGDH
ncbi:Complement C1q-like protein 4 [Mactra antiquata]